MNPNIWVLLSVTVIKILKTYFDSNVYARRFRKISPRIWNVLQTKIDVNVSISKLKSTSKVYFMEHDLEIIYTT